ncbi:MAG: DJ-1/PfpI family protein [Acidobacteria bacterium]|nr:DJ-1/PfpI family protein [Acidobacteriota bacterium]
MSTEQPKRVALLIEDEFEDADVAATSDLLRSAGVTVVIVGPIAGRTHRGRKSTEVVVELAAGRAHAREFDAVLIPGGYAPDRMRMRHAMTDLVRDMLAANKPVAAIDRGAQLLISVKAVAGRTITCWPSIAIDIKNAGGRYVDRPVVEDNGVITARKADDVPHFAAAILKALGNLQPAS